MSPPVFPPEQARVLVARLLAWYAAHRRDLPWRHTRDPYRIWVAEVMLQQTRVETVLAYYARFLEQFPTLEALARAEEAAVLKAWEGLGYYRRAIHLWRGAREALARHGSVPRTYRELRRLPGVGEYTARSLLAIAFEQPFLPVDGNVRRVLARLRALEGLSPRAFQHLADSLIPAIPEGRYGDTAQALMELGATVCTPRAPACDRCPVQAVCEAFRQGDVEAYPRKMSRKVPFVPVVVAYLLREGRVLVGRRKRDRMLGGLWELPGGKVRSGESLEEALRREIREETGIRELRNLSYRGSVHHAYTHLRVELHLFVAETSEDVSVVGEAEILRWVDPEELNRLPIPRGTRKVLALLRDS